jgi:hypothetical protein
MPGLSSRWSLTGSRCRSGTRTFSTSAIRQFKLGGTRFSSGRKPRSRSSAPFDEDEILASAPDDLIGGFRYYEQMEGGLGNYFIASKALHLTGNRSALRTFRTSLSLMKTSSQSGPAGELRRCDDRQCKR